MPLEMFNYVYVVTRTISNDWHSKNIHSRQLFLSVCKTNMYFNWKLYNSPLNVAENIHIYIYMCVCRICTLHSSEIFCILRICICALLHRNLCMTYLYVNRMHVYTHKLYELTNRYKFSKYKKSLCYTVHHTVRYMHAYFIVDSHKMNER